MDYEFANFINSTFTDVYNKNKNDENYVKVLKELSYEVCKYLETHGAMLNRTDLTEEWLKSEERKDFRREGLIK